MGIISVFSIFWAIWLEKVLCVKHGVTKNELESGHDKRTRQKSV